MTLETGNSDRRQRLLFATAKGRYEVGIGPRLEEFVRAANLG